MTKLDDQLLRDRLAADDELVLIELYDQYWLSLFQYVGRILMDQEDVTDVVQETFIKIWTIRHHLQHVKSLKGYLYIIARNKAFKTLQEKLKKETVLEHYAYILDKFDFSTFDRVHAQELAEIIDNEIKKLPSRMREVFILSRRENLSYKEIADRLQISSETVKKQISLSLKHLKNHLPQEYYYSLQLLIILDILAV